MPHKDPKAKSEYMKKRYRRKRAEIKAYQKAYYGNHRDEIKEARRPYQRTIYLHRCVVKRLAYVLREGGKCTKCDLDNITILQFHHRDPEQKSFVVGDAIRDNKGKHSLEEIDAEISKCDLLCPNCHTSHHNSLTSEELCSMIQLAKKYFSEAEKDGSL